MTEEERGELLEDEYLIVRNSGEIPEITYHASLYFLEEDPDGPGLELTDLEKMRLLDGAVLRYQEIVLRDIQMENFHKTIYRGIQRTIYNWHRYHTFCARQDLDCYGFRETVVETFLLFLREGVASAGDTVPYKFLNCTRQELRDFSEALHVTDGQLPDCVFKHC